MFVTCKHDELMNYQFSWNLTTYAIVFISVKVMQDLTVLRGELSKI